MTLSELHEVAKKELVGLTTVTNPDFRLEEAEYDKASHIWNVVVSYLVNNTNKRVNALGSLTSEFEYHRIYKKLRINDHRELVGLYMHNS